MVEQPEAAHLPEEVEQPEAAHLPEAVEQPEAVHLPEAVERLERLISGRSPVAEILRVVTQPEGEHHPTETKTDAETPSDGNTAGTQTPSDGNAAGQNTPTVTVTGTRKNKAIKTTVTADLIKQTMEENNGKHTDVTIRVTIRLAT